MTGDAGQIHGPIATPRWPDRLRLPLRFDPASLRTDLARLGNDGWTAHYVPEHYRGDWTVLPLRAPAGATHPVLRIAPHAGCTEWEGTEMLAASPYFRQVLGSFQCPLQAARLMRLAPGSTIKPHRDADLSAERGVARLHIPIATNPDVDFRLNGTRIEMSPGSAWYLRLADPHSVTNAGATARIHLVVDMVVVPWLEDLLDRAS